MAAGVIGLVQRYSILLLRNSYLVRRETLVWSSTPMTCIARIVSLSNMTSARLARGNLDFPKILVIRIFNMATSVLNKTT